MIGRLRGSPARELLRAGVLAAAMLVAPLAQAETGWVDDQVRLNLRTGPGNQYRIISSVETGDSVEILERGDGWIQVNAAGKQGWVPEGYLLSEPPAKVKLARVESELEQLRARAKQSGDDTDKLRAEKQQLEARESEQRAELDRLTRDNARLSGGARWPEWIAGACILAVGMGLGALLRGSARRQTPKIRL
jgi:SH3 domain protein